MKTSPSPKAPSTKYDVVVASAIHGRFAESVSRAIRREIEAGAVGLALRSPALIREKIESGEAVIAQEGDAWIGFCYVQPWEGGSFVSTSGLIVKAARRGLGVGRRLKERALELSRERYPGSALFGLSTSEAVWKVSSDLGFRAVPYHRLPRDPEFWKGCESCRFHSSLLARGGRSCHCRAMLLSPAVLSPAVLSPTPPAPASSRAQGSKGAFRGARGAAEDRRARGKDEVTQG